MRTIFFLLSCLWVFSSLAYSAVKTVSFGFPEIIGVPEVKMDSSEDFYTGDWERSVNAATPPHIEYRCHFTGEVKKSRNGQVTHVRHNCKEKIGHSLAYSVRFLTQKGGVNLTQIAKVNHYQFGFKVLPANEQKKVSCPLHFEVPLTQMGGEPKLKMDPEIDEFKYAMPLGLLVSKLSSGQEYEVNCHYSLGAQKAGPHQGVWFKLAVPAKACQVGSQNIMKCIYSTEVTRFKNVKNVFNSKTGLSKRALKKLKQGNSLKRRRNP